MADNNIFMNEDFIQNLRYIGFVPIAKDDAFMYYYYVKHNSEIKIHYKNGGILADDVFFNQTSIRKIINESGKDVLDARKDIVELFNFILQNQIPGYDVIVSMIIGVLYDSSIDTNNKIRMIGKILREAGIIR